MTDGTQHRADSRRRVMTLAVLLLLLGAVTNIGVAWVCAGWDWPGREYDRDWSTRPHAGWAVDCVYGLGFDERCAVPEASTFYDRSRLDDATTADVPRWSAVNTPPATERPFVCEQAGGWPLRSLRCKWSTSDLTQIWADFRPSGGICTTFEALAPGVRVTPGTWYTLRGLPLTPCWFGFAVDTIVFAAIWGVVCILPFSLAIEKRLKRRWNGLCESCAYDLQGIDSARCPECGWPFRKPIPIITARFLTVIALVTLSAVVIDAAGFVTAQRLRKGLEPIHDAARDGDLTALAQYLDSGVSVNEPVTTGPAEIRGMTPLMWAALADQKEAVECLLSRGADTLATDATGRSALHWAAVYDAGDAIRVLLQRGIDPDCVDKYGMTPLLLACFDVHKRDRVAAVSALLEAGADPDIVCFGVSSLGWAASWGIDESVRLLLDAGADPNSLGAEATPLQLAARAGEYDIAKALLDAGATYQNPDLELVEHAVIGGNAELVALLLDLGAPMEPRDSYGRTLLHEAVDRKNLAMIKRLIAEGCDPKELSDEGETILFTGNWAADPDLAAFLMSLNIDLDAVNVSGQTALMLRSGASWVDLPAVKYLLEAGADPTIKDQQGMTARDHAEYILQDLTRTGQDTREVEKVIQILKDAEPIEPQG